MAEWKQQEMEELIAKMTKKAMTDAAFRKEVLEDATSALEKLAGKPLPEGMTLKCVERDPNFQNTLVLPDFVDEEKLDEGALSNVAGGTGSCWAKAEVCTADTTAQRLFSCGGKLDFITVIGLGGPGTGKPCHGYACMHEDMEFLRRPNPLISDKKE